MQNASITTKPHYPILDGLRGVAALIVVAFHILEAHATSHLDQIINHGYLAVDFFFLLSGFVISYAYDDRWDRLSIKDFFKRRLIRLQPMVVMGMLIGAVFFYFQASDVFPLISETSIGKLILITLIGFTLIPIPPSIDIRGWAEMHPLNGPGWSLFFEYIANILYALFIRKLSNKVLSILVLISGIALIHLATTSPNGDIIGGWSISPEQLRIGFTRMLFPFFAGILMCRTFKLSNIKNAFLWSSLLVIVILAFPRIGGTENLWLNGLYESLSIILLFPLIIYIGASGQVKGKTANKICTFLGDISYPIYITHFPLIYTYFSYVNNNKLSLKEAAPFGILTYIAAVLIAYLSLKFYDIPVRKWLQKK